MMPSKKSTNMTCPKCGGDRLHYDLEDLEIKGAKLTIPFWCDDCAPLGRNDFNVWKLMLFKRKDKLFLKWRMGS